MKTAPVLSVIFQPGLLIALAFWLMSGASAQIPGPGQVGGMGQGGAPTGEFASDRGNAITGQRNTPTGDFPAESFPKNKDANKDANKGTDKDTSGGPSSVPSTQPEKRNPGAEANAPAKEDTGGERPPVNADAQRK